MIPKRTIAVTVLLISALQGVYFVIAPSSIAVLRPMGILLAIGGLLCGSVYLARKSSYSLVITVILYAAQLAIFAMQPAVVEGAVPLRPLRVAILLASAAPLLATARIPSPWWFAAPAVLLLAEGITPVPLSSAPDGSASLSTLLGAMTPDSRLGAVPPQHQTITSFQSGDPRGYFVEVEPRKVWLLRVAGNSKADLHFARTDPEGVRVAIARAASDKQSYIQLDLPGFRVTGGAKYQLSLEARSDRPRKMFVGMAKANWQGLGFYQEVALDSHWRTFQAEFAPIADDNQAMLLFDLNGSDTAVDLSKVRLRGGADRAVLQPSPSGNGVRPVSYRWNAMGCRGPDFPMPKPPGVIRFLVLGGGSAFGAGIPEETALSSQLEQLLNNSAADAPRSEVINCAVPGYGTHEQRLFYETRAAQYQSDVVILAVSWSDYLSFQEQADEFRGHRPSSAEMVFHTWQSFRDYQRRRPIPDFSRSIEEIRQLDAAVRAKGARLAVLLFRNNTDYAGVTPSGRIWNLLDASITGGLRGSDIPLVDLGKALLQMNSLEALTANAAIPFSPNGTAHTIAANALVDALREHHMISR